MVYIDSVHYETDCNGREVISQLKWTTSLYTQATCIWSKEQMIYFIKQSPNSVKTKYYSYNGWRVGEDVRVVDSTYLRTDSNNIKADNLGSLPTF